MQTGASSLMACFIGTLSASMIRAEPPPTEFNLRWSRGTAADADSGGPAGWERAAVIYDNGPLITVQSGALCGGGAESTVQVISLCLRLFGEYASGEGSADYWVADDFTLGCRATVQHVVLFAYESAALGPSLTGGTVRVYSGQPTAPNNPALRESTTRAGAATQTGIQRAGEDPGPCILRIQRIKFAFDPPLELPRGTYWVCWQLEGSNLYSGPWAPPVTILGQTGKPGANALRAFRADGPFTPVVDPGATSCPPPPAPFPQDFPFQLEGMLNCACSGDADLDGDTDQDDIDVVLFNYGASVPPGTSGDLDGDGHVDQRDLDLVLFDFGCRN